MKEKLCPFCAKPVRSDASAEKFCKLCGMFIDNTDPQFIYITEKGVGHYFCCKRCLETYVSTFSQIENGDEIVTIEDTVEGAFVEFDGEEIYLFYSKFGEDKAHIPTVNVNKRETRRECQDSMR